MRTILRELTLAYELVGEALGLGTRERGELLACLEEWCPVGSIRHAERLGPPVHSSHPAGTVLSVIPLRAEQPSSRFPFVTLALIAGCVLAFLAQPNDPVAEQEFFLERASIPCELEQGSPLTIAEALSGECGIEVGGQGSVEIAPDKNVWTATFVSLFLHGDLWHLIGNMLFLWVFGRNVEDHLGAFWFAAAYVVFGIAAEAAHVLTNLGSTVPVIGASGAIAGIMGMYLVLWPRARVLTLVVWLVVAIPAWFVLGAWIALQFFTDPNSGVAYAAHIGGFFAGVAVGIVVRAASPPAPTWGAWSPPSDRYPYD